MHVDIFKRDITHEMDAHHHHASHPEKQDVESGYQHGGRVKGFQQGGLFRPPHCRKRPQGRAEPGVQHIRFLNEVIRAAVRTLLRCLHGHHDLAASTAGPGRNLMTPPDLAGDAPVADIVHPVIIGVGPHLRYDFGLAGFNSIDGFFRQGLHADKPLFR